jgi:hypothetical protein
LYARESVTDRQESNKGCRALGVTSKRIMFNLVDPSASLEILGFEAAPEARPTWREAVIGGGLLMMTAANVNTTTTTGESSAMTPGSSSSNDFPSSMGRDECYRELESMGIECDKFNEFLEGRIVQELPLIIDLLRYVGSHNPDPAALNLLVAALSSGAGIPTSMGTVDEIKHKLESMGIEKCESMGIDKKEFIDAMRTARKDLYKETTSSAATPDVDEVIVDAASFSVGDSVQIMGLVGAPQYNDMRGIVVSDFDSTTNRCGVKVHGKGPILALQVHNLTMIRKAKKSSGIGGVDVNVGNVVANEVERSKASTQKYGHIT